MTVFYPASKAWEVSRVTEGLSETEINLLHFLFANINSGVAKSWIQVDVNASEYSYSSEDVSKVVNKLTWLGYKVSVNKSDKIEGFHHISINWLPDVQSRVKKYQN